MPPPRFLLRSFSLSPVLLFLLLAAGCGQFHPKPSQEYVYVSGKGGFLRDRIAAVSNRVAEVSNGQRLLVLEHGRRFLKVKTEKNEIGWIPEPSVISQDVYQQFETLRSDHAHDPVIATAVLRDESYLHAKPGRQAERFYLLPESDKLQLLVRASVPKPVPPQAVPVAKPVKAGKGVTAGKPAVPEPPPPPPMEDYWLIRDSQGRVGWVRAHAMDVDVPEEIAGLAEGQRYIGAYLLRTVNDPESKFPNGQAPEYVTVFSPYKDGLPYDFDQVRVFTWNVKRHRYETAYRQRKLEGYLPVTVTQGTTNGQETPSFSLKLASGDAVTIDPQTGSAKAAQTETQTFRLEGVQVKRVEAPGKPADVAPAPPPDVAPVQAPPSKKTAKRAGKGKIHPLRKRHKQR